MLVVTAHPGIGAGLEALLQLERYEVRRIARPSERGALGDWKPDAVLVDGALLGEPLAAFDAPTFVLSGTAADGEQLAQRVGARGWLPKDVTAAELRARLGETVGVEPASNAGSVLRGLVVVLLAVVVGAVASAAWLGLGIGR